MFFNKITNLILDLLFPKKDEIMEIEKMDPEEMLSDIPKAKELDEGWIKSIFHYKDKRVKRAVWELKYKANKKVSEKFGIILYDFILEEISDMASFSDIENVLIVPIPASKDRNKRYGFNQCELLVKEILKCDKSGFMKNAENILKKIKDTQHQVKVGARKGRLKNIGGSFCADGRARRQTVIVVDDVVTTGATMIEARRALLSAGALKVLCISIAH